MDHYQIDLIILLLILSHVLLVNELLQRKCINLFWKYTLLVYY